MGFDIRAAHFFCCVVTSEVMFIFKFVSFEAVLSADVFLHWTSPILLISLPRQQYCDL